MFAEITLSDLVSPGHGGLNELIAQIGDGLGKGGLPVGQTEQILSDHDLSVAGGSGTTSDDGYGRGFDDGFGDFVGNRFQQQQSRPAAQCC